MYQADLIRIDQSPDDGADEGDRYGKCPILQTNKATQNSARSLGALHEGTDANRNDPDGFPI